MTLFSPEHGFRGTADAGQHVASSVDEVTGIPIASLYNGGKRGPSPEVMAGVDVILVDLQDVGTRFYTYYITMLDVMEAAARHGKSVIVLDRPNPLGMSVDGPVLDMKLRSGVGRLPIPVLHGLTLGEMAKMAVGEGWLPGASSLDLKVVPLQGLHPLDTLCTSRGSVAQSEEHEGHIPLSVAVLLRGNYRQRGTRNRYAVPRLRSSAHEGSWLLVYAPVACRCQESAFARQAVQWRRPARGR